jgi:hypothetical protein
MRPHRYRLRMTVWLIRRIIAVLDVIAAVCDRIDEWNARPTRYPRG